jgi:peptidyl-prolyl cis-trans isomerase SurA
VQQALAAGRDFAAVAQEFSEGPNARRGGRIGAVRPGDLFDRVLDQTVAQLAEGGQRPVVSTRGVHILRLDRLEAGGARVISQIFFPIDIQEQDVGHSPRRIVAARERILAGEPFSLVAAEVSEDPASAAAGGLLGTFQVDELSPAFQEALAGAAVGEVTEPMQTTAGWYIFQVLDRDRRTPLHLRGTQRRLAPLRRESEDRGGAGELHRGSQAALLRRHQGLSRRPVLAARQAAPLRPWRPT